MAYKVGQRVRATRDYYIEGHEGDPQFLQFRKGEDLIVRWVPDASFSHLAPSQRNAVGVSYPRLTGRWITVPCDWIAAIAKERR